MIDASRRQPWLNEPLQPFRPGRRQQQRAGPQDGVHEELEVSEIQVRRFLSSPLGAEIALLAAVAVLLVLYSLRRGRSSGDGPEGGG